VSDIICIYVAVLPAWQVFLHQSIWKSIRICVNGHNCAFTIILLAKDCITY